MMSLAVTGSVHAASHYPTGVAAGNPTPSPRPRAEAKREGIPVLQVVAAAKREGIPVLRASAAAKKAGLLNPPGASFLAGVS